MLLYNITSSLIEAAEAQMTTVSDPYATLDP